MAKVTIKYSFDLNEEREEFNNVVRSIDARNLLYEIDQDIRAKLKYGEDEWLKTKASDFLEELRSKIWESGLMNE